MKVVVGAPQDGDRLDMHRQPRARDYAVETQADHQMERALGVSHPFHDIVLLIDVADEFAAAICGRCGRVALHGTVRVGAGEHRLQQRAVEIGLEVRGRSGLLRRRAGDARRREKKTEQICAHRTSSASPPQRNALPALRGQRFRGGKPHRDRRAVPGSAGVPPACAKRDEGADRRSAPGETPALPRVTSVAIMSVDGQN